ncbi:MAG: hypothetical protein MUC86_06330 [Burkholderiaceae bacterium]|nr:hypothetical protein [Burkholderiaceae bacterium]
MQDKANLRRRPASRFGVARGPDYARVALDAVASVAPTLEDVMTLCPIAIVAGCAKCPAFKVCPLKGVIGDQKKPEPSPPAARAKKK